MIPGNLTAEDGRAESNRRLAPVRLSRGLLPLYVRVAVHPSKLVSKGLLSPSLAAPGWAVGRVDWERDGMLLGCLDYALTASLRVLYIAV